MIKKKKKLALWLMIMCFALGTNAQERNSESLNRNIIKLNVLSTVLQQQMISYERVWNHKWSSQISIAYFKQEYANDQIKLSASSQEISIDTKFFTGQFKNGPEGFYFSGFVTLLFLNENEVYTDYKLEGLAGFLGPSLGHQWGFGKFMLDVYSGFGIQFVSPKESLIESYSLNNNYLLGGLYFKYGVSIGYLF